MKSSLLGLMLVVFLKGMPSANASVAVTFSGGSLVDLPNSESFVVGYNFMPKSAIVVDGLGFFDYGSDGLLNNHFLALFDLKANTKMVEIEITNTNSTLLGPIINSTGQFRVVDIAPILLVPQLFGYNVAAQLLAGQMDPWYGAPNGTDFYDWDSSLLSGAGPAGLFTETTNVALPSVSDGSRYGPVSFRARLATIGEIPDIPIDIDLPPRGDPMRVPESGILSLLGLGLAGLALLRRRTYS